MIIVSYDRSVARLRMHCTSVWGIRFEYCWKYVYNGVKTGLNQPLNRGGGLESPVFLYPLLGFQVRKSKFKIKWCKIGGHAN